MLEASHYDAASAYAVVNSYQQRSPLIYRTRDYGHTWQLITGGLPDSGNARVVREDPARKDCSTLAHGTAFTFRWTTAITGKPATESAYRFSY